MNDKENKLRRICEIVVGCCATEIDGKSNISITDVMSKNREENVVMTRQILSMQLNHLGYTFTTISQLLHCTPHNVRKLIADGYNNLKMLRAFQFAYAEATLRIKSDFGF